MERFKSGMPGYYHETVLDGLGATGAVTVDVPLVGIDPNKRHIQANHTAFYEADFSVAHAPVSGHVKLCYEQELSWCGCSSICCSRAQ